MLTRLFKLAKRSPLNSARDFSCSECLYKNEIYEKNKTKYGSTTNNIQYSIRYQSTAKLLCSHKNHHLLTRPSVYQNNQTSFTPVINLIRNLSTSSWLFDKKGGDDDDNDHKNDTNNNTKKGEHNYKIVNREQKLADQMHDLELAKDPVQMSLDKVDWEKVHANDARYQPILDCPKCGATGDKVSRVNPRDVSSGFFICSSCNSVYMADDKKDTSKNIYNKDDTFRQEQEKKKLHEYIENNKTDLPPNPRLINQYLEQYVIGQEDARKTLAVATYNHYKRIKQNFFMDLIKNGIPKQEKKAQNQPGMRPGMAPNLQMANPAAPRGIQLQMIQAQKQDEEEPEVDPNEPLHFHHIEALSGKNLKEKMDKELAFAANRNKEDLDEVALEKSNIILVGPTGAGKTHIVKTLAQALGVPFAVADATTLTAAGYVGDDADTVIKKLLDAADGDIKRAETGIVFIDEIDKIAINKGAGNAKDIGGEGVQQALLKIIEGTTVEIKKKQPSLQPEEPQVVDTSNILFIASGAFVGLEKIIGNRLDKKQMGFSALSGKKKENSVKSPTSQGGFGLPQKATDKQAKYLEIVKQTEDRDKLMKNLIADDLQQFGLIPEFIGRMPVRASLKGLTEEDLIKILIEPKNAIVPQYKALFKLDNVDLDITDNGLKEIARKALMQKTGARGLRSILEDLLLNSMYDIPDSNIKTVVVNEETVRDGTSPEYIYEEDSGATYKANVDMLESVPIKVHSAGGN